MFWSAWSHTERLYIPESILHQCKRWLIKHFLNVNYSKSRVFPEIIRFMYFMIYMISDSELIFSKFWKIWDVILKQFISVNIYVKIHKKCNETYNSMMHIITALEGLNQKLTPYALKYNIIVQVVMELSSNISLIFAFLQTLPLTHSIITSRSNAPLPPRIYRSLSFLLHHIFTFLGVLLLF